MCVCVCVQGKKKKKKPNNPVVMLLNSILAEAGVKTLLEIRNNQGRPVTSENVSMADHVKLGKQALIQDFTCRATFCKAWASAGLCTSSDNFSEL